MKSHRSYPDAVYQGKVDSHKRPQGVGCIKDESQGIEYIGEMVRGFAHGHGMLKMPDGQCFAGQFLDGAINGYGTLTTSDGINVTGNFKDGDELTIHGRVTFADGSLGLPYHEGPISDQCGLTETVKVPAEVELGVNHASIAETIALSFQDETSADFVNDSEDDSIDIPPTTNLDDCKSSVDDVETFAQSENCESTTRLLSDSSTIGNDNLAFIDVDNMMSPDPVATAYKSSV